MIDKTTTIEELVERHPQSVSFLLNRGIHCLACGEPVWGTIESYMLTKGYNSMEIDSLVVRLNLYLQKV